MAHPPKPDFIKISKDHPPTQHSFIEQHYVGFNEGRGHFGIGQVKEVRENGKVALVQLDNEETDIDLVIKIENTVAQCESTPNEIVPQHRQDAPQYTTNTSIFDKVQYNNFFIILFYFIFFRFSSIPS